MRSFVRTWTWTVNLVPILSNRLDHMGVTCTADRSGFQEAGLSQVGLLSCPVGYSNFYYPKARAQCFIYDAVSNVCIGDVQTYACFQSAATITYPLN